LDEKVSKNFKESFFDFGFRAAEPHKLLEETAEGFLSDLEPLSEG